MADSYTVVQQVQGLHDAYNAAREKVAALEAELFTRKEDIRRLEKRISELETFKPAPTKIAEVK